MINVPNLKYKTTLCLNWQEGTPCQKGLNCYFAHGEHQLRKIEENQQVIASRNMYYMNYQHSGNYKTVYCKFYAKGQCKLGASCTFAHQKKQKRKSNKPIFCQQPPLISYMQFSMPFIYPPYQNFDPVYYYTQNMEFLGNYQNRFEEMSPILKSSESIEIQPKSEQKKRSQIGENSTNEKSREDIQNQEQRPKSQPQNKCFNFQ